MAKVSCPMKIFKVNTKGICELCGGSRLVKPYFIFKGIELKRNQKNGTLCEKHLKEKLKKRGLVWNKD